MSEQEERHQDRSVNIRSQISIHTSIIVIFVPVSLVGIVVFLVYIGYHWNHFIGQTASIFSWLLFFGGLCLWVGLSWCVMKVLKSGVEVFTLFGQGVVQIYHKWVEARGQVARTQLLHADTNYVVHLDKGKVVVTPVTQEKITYNIRQSGQEAIVDASPHTALPLPVKSFHDLLTSGVVERAIEQGKMLLGYRQGVLRYGSWLDLYSCGIGGVSGSGKTTTVRFLLFQAILAHARLIMIDPHIGDPEESLAAQFRMFEGVHMIRPCDGTATSVLHRVRWLKQEIASRTRDGRKTPFLVFVVDEFNAVMRVKEVRDEMSELLVSIAQEGRKFGLFAMLIGQRWSSQDIGGADIRTSLASTLAHRFTDEDQARKLVGSRNGPKCLELAKGHHLFRDTDGAIMEMVTPYTEVEDGILVQQLLNSSSLSPRTNTDIETDEGETMPTVKRLEKPRDTVKDGEIFTDEGESFTDTDELFSPSEETAILHAALQVQQEKGKVYRSDIKVKLGWNNKRWGTIKAVCDKYGIAQ